MDQKFEDKKRSPGPSKEDRSTSDGSFIGDRTIPGDFSPLGEVTEHDAGSRNVAYTGGTLPDMSAMIDPDLDDSTVDSEYPDFTQTDLSALDEADPMEQRAHEEMHALLVDCIDVLDQVSDALVSVRQRALDTDAIAELEQVETHFIARLGAYGVRRELGVGTAYDPELQEIAKERAVESAAQDGVVLDVERPGYTRNGHPLRRAQVVVGKKD